MSGVWGLGHLVSGEWGSGAEYGVWTSGALGMGSGFWGMGSGVWRLESGPGLAGLAGMAGRACWPGLAGLAGLAWLAWLALARPAWLGWPGLAGLAWLALAGPAGRGIWGPELRFYCKKQAFGHVRCQKHENSCVFCILLKLNVTFS